jgi:uncharacterized protein YoxC
MTFSQIIFYVNAVFAIAFCVLCIFAVVETYKLHKTQRELEKYTELNRIRQTELSNKEKEKLYKNLLEYYK